MSGGYDDQDHGDEIIYTGHGGRNSNTGRQIADQELVRGNLGLVRSQNEGLPVRVIRGTGGNPAYSPAKGYRYDGLFRVVDHWNETGSDGFKVWRFRLVKTNDHRQRAMGTETIPDSDVETDNGTGHGPAEHEHWTSDAPAETDTLKRDALASVLAARLRRYSSNDPENSFLLHLDGPWGTGKSTLLKLLRRHLEQHYLVVPFDAWKHSKVEPPWWALLMTLRQHIYKELPLWRRIPLRAAETSARARRGVAPYVLTAVLLILMFGALALLIPSAVTATGAGQLVKNISIGFGGFFTLVASLVLFSRFVWWDSARGARRLEQAHTNPMQEVTEHFSWLLGRSPRRVVFFLDDLDRCDEKYVVEFLDAVQTLVRDAPQSKAGTAKSAYFVVAAHGNWLRRAYETIHLPFQGAIDEPGRSLGHLFLDKLFQLTVPMPTLGSQTKQQYLDGVLGIQAPGDEVADDDDPIFGQIEDSSSERDILEALRSASPKQRERSAPRAVERLSEPMMSEITEHALQDFAKFLDGNPRSIKRFLNTYSVLRATRTLEGIPVDSEALAFWTVLRVRWPLLTELLETNLDSVTRSGESTVHLDLIPGDFPLLWEDPELHRLLADAPVRLTPELIRSCCGALTSSETDSATESEVGMP